MEPILGLLAHLPRRLRHGLITLLGLVTLVCPILLWTAWSKTVFWAVIAAACASILLICLLLQSAPEDDF
ncbi:MAG TPA: hypothetical protein VFZ01_07795 [Geminicoccaceae bacterium]